VQPLFAELAGGGFAVAHNGNLTNGLTLRRNLIQDGAICQSTTDTEVIVHLVARSRRNRFIDRFVEAIQQLEGAYALVAMTNKKLVGARDPHGIRPWCWASSTGATSWPPRPAPRHHRRPLRRDIENGEVVVISEEGSNPSASRRSSPPALRVRVHLLRPARTRS
jgi:amidophosphoribosyltransferase